MAEGDALSESAPNSFIRFLFRAVNSNDVALLLDTHLSMLLITYISCVNSFSSLAGSIVLG